MLRPPLRQSFFLFGPRGVGKSAWTRTRFPDAAVFDLLDSDTYTYTRLLASPSRLGEQIPSGHRGWVVIDEIQRLPDLLNEVHRLIETRRLKFVLTGSSARTLRRRGVNLLAGRAVTRFMHPLTAREIAVRLPVFTRRAKRKVVAHPKFYFFDPGVFQAVRPRGPLDSTDEIRGAALETLTLQQLRALNDYLAWGYRLHYWRTPGGDEVDFVLYGERGLVAVEVKMTSRVRAEDLRGLRRFLTDCPQARAFFVYTGTRRLHESGIDVVPANEMIGSLAGTLG